MIAITINGPPLRKNERHEIVAPRARRPFLKNSEAYEAFAWRTANAWRIAGHEPICSGAWHIDCVAYHKRSRRLDVTVAFGDVDAAVSAALDALQACGAIDDDVRFTTCCLAKHVDAARPRLELTLRPSPPGGKKI
jgi:Holliday junction resolvase RusA-like endonuclease